MMSFNLTAVAAISRDIMRGALIMPSMLTQDRSLDSAISDALHTAPDYLACHVTDAPRAAALAADAALPLVVWTVSSEDMSSLISPFPVAQIFEGFIPPL